MISNIIIVDSEHINQNTFNFLNDFWDGSKNLVSLLEECIVLNADIDLYLPANIFFYTNAQVIRFLIKNNLYSKFKYDKDTYRIYQTFSTPLLEKLLVVNPYTNAKLGGYMFLYEYQDIGLMYNNKVIYATIDATNISEYINNETVFKYEAWIVSTIKAFARGDYLYKSSLLNYIDEQSINALLQNNILRMDGKRYYLNNLDK